MLSILLNADKAANFYLYMNLGSNFSIFSLDTLIVSTSIIPRHYRETIYLAAYVLSGCDILYLGH